MCVSRILVVNKGDPGVERLVHFVAMVAGSRTRAAGLTGQSEDECEGFALGTSAGRPAGPGRVQHSKD